MSAREYDLSEHLAGLRAVIIKSAIFLFITAGFTYAYVNSILPFVIKPVGRLVFIEPQEALFANIKIAFFIGIFLSLPFVLFLTWKFIAEGLYDYERRYVLIFGPLSYVLFILGVAFGYFVIVPIGIKFLLGFATEYISPMITVSKYVSFVGTMSMNFGLVFELPLIILFLTKIGVVTPAFLIERRKHAVVILFVLAAIFTPPDAITQCLMAVPLMLLYEVGIIFSKLAYKKSTELKGDL